MSLQFLDHTEQVADEPLGWKSSSVVALGCKEWKKRYSETLSLDFLILSTGLAAFDAKGLLAKLHVWVARLKWLCRKFSWTTPMTQSKMARAPRSEILQRTLPLRHLVGSIEARHQVATILAERRHRMPRSAEETPEAIRPLGCHSRQTPVHIWRRSGCNLWTHLITVLEVGVGRTHLGG